MLSVNIPQSVARCSRWQRRGGAYTREGNAPTSMITGPTELMCVVVGAVNKLLASCIGPRAHWAPRAL